MGDNKTAYTITINLSSLPKGNSAMAEQESSTIGGLNDNVSDSATYKAAQNLVSFATVAATADKLISANISQVNLKTGAAEYEQQLNAAYSAGKQIIGAGATLAMGAATGTLPIVAIGMFISGISKMLEISKKSVQLNMERSLEDISINMQNVRAGTSGRRSPNQ